MLAAIEEQAQAGYPEEACGVLLGRICGAEREVTGAEASANLRRDRRCECFELDPGAIVAASSRARSEGLELVGFWHSHPDRPAWPSAEDCAGTWDERSCLILAVAAGRVTERKCFRLVAGVLREELLLVRPGSGS